MVNTVRNLLTLAMIEMRGEFNGLRWISLPCHGPSCLPIPLEAFAEIRRYVDQKGRV